MPQPQLRNAASIPRAEAQGFTRRVDKINEFVKLITQLDGDMLLCYTLLEK